MVKKWKLPLQQGPSHVIVALLSIKYTSSCCHSLSWSQRTSKRSEREVTSTITKASHRAEGRRDHALLEVGYTEEPGLAPFCSYNLHFSKKHDGCVSLQGADLMSQNIKGGWIWRLWVSRPGGSLFKENGVCIILMAYDMGPRRAVLFTKSSWASSNHYGWSRDTWRHERRWLNLV